MAAVLIVVIKLFCFFSFFSASDLLHNNQINLAAALRKPPQIDKLARTKKTSDTASISSTKTSTKGKEKASAAPAVKIPSHHLVRFFMMVASDRTTAPTQEHLLPCASLSSPSFSRSAKNVVWVTKAESRVTWKKTVRY